MVLSVHQLVLMVVVVAAVMVLCSIGEMIITGKPKYSEINVCHCHIFDKISAGITQR
jgi:hypothetical protein